MLMHILEQALLFLPLALGIYISYAVLRIPDLTTDGSFVLGAAIFALCLHAHIHPLIALFAATASGILAGMAVSFVHIRFDLNPLIAGILLVFILNTATLKIMGRPNLSLFNYPTLFFFPGEIMNLVMLSMLACVLIGALGLFLSSRCGLMLYAFGNNPMLLNLSGKNAHIYRIIGLSLSNALVACSGALTAQANGYADIGMGTGIILSALGTVIIGQQLCQSFVKKMQRVSYIALFFCVVGVLVYFSIVNALISVGLDPLYLRLMVGVCLIGFLAMTKKNRYEEAAV